MNPAHLYETIDLNGTHVIYRGTYESEWKSCSSFQRTQCHNINSHEINSHEINSFYVAKKKANMKHMYLT